MPLIRKIVPIGGSKAVTLPKSWLDHIERETGRKVVEVAVEVDGTLRIMPYFRKEMEKS
jgi:antitoxin component of MazEF toxin-antitoxin module